MATRYQETNSGSSPSSHDDSRRIMYSCRMQYLKPREGGNHKERRKASIDIPGCDEARPHFSCLDERVHGPCSSEILLPPNELMTRTKAFRFAYWKHHREPTMRTIKKLEFGQNERNERLNNKRKEILTRMELKAKKESELRGRTERVANHSYGPMEKDSEDESESDPTSQNNISEALVRGTFPNLAQDDDSRDERTISPSMSKRKTRLGMISSSSTATRIERLDESNGDFLSPFAFLSDQLCRMTDPSPSHAS